MVCAKNLPWVTGFRFDGNPAARFGTTVGNVELYVSYDVPDPTTIIVPPPSIFGPSVVLPYPYRGTYRKGAQELRKRALSF
eukprot:scaffold176511_cov65-Attheya_sp.AAC.1